MSALIRLYDRAWRDRYEAEIRFILEARPPTLRDRIDLVLGALDSRLHPRLPGAGIDRPRQGAPITAALAIASGLAWLTWVGIGLSDFHGWDGPMPANPGLIIALGFVAGLVLAVTHVAVMFSAGTFLRPGGGLAASIAAVLFAAAALGAGMLGPAALIASAVVGHGLGRGAIPRWIGAAWTGAALLSAAAMIGFVVGGGRDVWLLRSIASFGLVWLAIGGSLLVRGVPRPTATDLPTA